MWPAWMKVEPCHARQTHRSRLHPLSGQAGEPDPRQYECLTWVGRGLKTKRIALTLGISAGRVDKHILDARGKMGGMGRDEAGMIVAAYEASLGNETGGNYWAPSYWAYSRRQKMGLLHSLMTMRMHGPGETDGL